MKEKLEESAEDVLHDLDAMKGLAGKKWSVEFARKMGMSEDDIQKSLAGRE
jgi:hypothetical protein